MMSCVSKLLLRPKFTAVDELWCVNWPNTGFWPPVSAGHWMNYKYAAIWTIALHWTAAHSWDANSLVQWTLVLAGVCLLKQFLSCVCGIHFFQGKDNSCPEAVHALRLDGLWLASYFQPQEMAVDALHCGNGETYNTIQYNSFGIALLTSSEVHIEGSRSVTGGVLQLSVSWLFQWLCVGVVSLKKEK